MGSTWYHLFTKNKPFFMLILGLLVGSFLNVIIYRLPRKIDWIFKRSFCPSCNTQVSWYDNIPMLSFFILKRKCRLCGQKINIRYFLVEGLTATLFCIYSVYIFNNGPILYHVINLSIICLLICHFFIDLEHFLLLDRINFFLLLLLIAFQFFFEPIPWPQALFGMLLGFLVPYGIAWLFFKYSGKDGLGGGDIKLFTILGLQLGPVGIFENLFISSLLGIVGGLIYLSLQRSRVLKQPIPYGPAIIIAYLYQTYLSKYLNINFEHLFTLNL